MSGSGKSTLVNDILFRSLMQKIYRSKTPPGLHTGVDGIEHLDKVIDIDQSPIGRTPRSNPATYTGVFDHVRKLFAQTQEAKVRGYLPGRFSFNVNGGRCEACAGDGTIKIEMHFLPDVYVPCEVCKGARYNRDTLDITFKDKNIADVLDLSCEEALEFFANQPAIARHMQTLVDVGPRLRAARAAGDRRCRAARRSGSKLSSELAKRSTGHTIYILDEPTTGLHFEDIRKLLTVLSRLVDQGNTVLVIEHNLDVIKTADWHHRPRPRGRQRRRHGRGRGHARGGGRRARELDRPVPGPAAWPAATAGAPAAPTDGAQLAGDQPGGASSKPSKVNPGRHACSRPGSRRPVGAAACHAPSGTTPCGTWPAARSGPSTQRAGRAVALCR